MRSVSEVIRRGAIAGKGLEDVEGPLTEDEIEMLRLRAEAGLALREEEHELEMRIQRDEDRLRRDRRRANYELHRQEELDREELAERRSRRHFETTERSDLHGPRMSREWLRVGRSALGLAATGFVLYVCIKTGVIPQGLAELKEVAVP
jgi:hypothetical protein